MHRLALTLLVLTAAAPLALAQPDPAAEAQARVVFKEGVALAKAGKKREALARFQTAYQTFPAPLILLNVGAMHRDLGEPVEAARAYQRFLDDPTRPADRVKEAETALAALDKVIGRITFVIEPADSTPIEIALDGGAWEPLPASQPIRVAAGPHRVRARGGGGALVAESAADVAAGTEQRITLRLLADAPPAPDPKPVDPVVEPTPAQPGPVAPPVPEPQDPGGIVIRTARPPGRFGVLVHAIAQSELRGATAAVGASFAAHPRATVAIGAMAGGNYGGFATVTLAVLPSALRPTVTAGAVISYYPGTDAMTNPATTLFGVRGAVGGEWRASARWSAIADLAVEYYPSVPDHLESTSITPTVGVHARL